MLAEWILRTADVRVQLDLIPTYYHASLSVEYRFPDI